MFQIGCHLSSAKGFYAMGQNALQIGANTFQFFTRNPRGAKAKAIDEKDIERFLSFIKANNFGVLLAHAPYTLNPASSKQEVKDFAFQAMKDDLRRMEYTPNNYYNFHPGSHIGQGVEKGIEDISSLLNQLITKEQTTTILLETMSGKGSEIGATFEEISAILDKVEIKEKMGVCLDTCHVYDAGYDIVNDLDSVLSTFDKTIGLEYLKAIHLNDTKNPFSSHKDRHEKIGEGFLGIEAIKNIINHKDLRDLPFYLETPNELDGYQEEISILKGLRVK